MTSQRNLSVLTSRELFLLEAGMFLREHYSNELTDLLSEHSVAKVRMERMTRERDDAFTQVVKKTAIANDLIARCDTLHEELCRAKRTRVEPDQEVIAILKRHL